MRSGRDWLRGVMTGCRLLRSPGELPAMVVALATGVGLTVAAYSLIHAVLIRPLPYSEPERLVQIRDFDRTAGPPAPQGSKRGRPGRGPVRVPGRRQSCPPRPRPPARPGHDAGPALRRARVGRPLHGPGRPGRDRPDASTRGQPADERLADRRERAARAVGSGERRLRRSSIGALPTGSSECGHVLVPDRRRGLGAVWSSAELALPVSGWVGASP